MQHRPRPDVDRMVADLRAALNATERWAREASRKGGGDVPLGGVQWRWECPDHDVEMVPNPAVDETLRCPISEDCFSASLRSVEHFPTAGSDRPLPQFAVYSTDEQSAVVAEHIIRHDPASVLRLVVAHREMLDDLLSMPHYAWEGRDEYGCPKLLDTETWAALYGNSPQVCDCGRDAFVERMVRRLAAAYADRDGTDETGRPA